MDDTLEGLNEAQLEAVTSTEGYVRVIAGAGSGKTRALTRRFAYLVNELGIMPGNILCVTFTNKSAAEMRERIRRLCGDEGAPYVNTFHGFCVSVLHEESHAVGYPKQFLVLDNSDIDSMLEAIYEERGLTSRDMTYSAARDMFEMRKLFKEPGYYHDMLRLSPDELRKKYLEADKAEDILFYGYLWQEKKCFGFDYNDLIIVTLYIFRENPAIRDKWQERLEYVMIDEMQDIDWIQHELMKALVPYHKNLFVVGDPDQTIYTWRGANVKYITDFDKEFSPAKTVMMNENYRSTPEIIAAANALIAHNRERVPKELIPTLPGGERVICRLAEKQSEEAAWIAGQIAALRGSGERYRDITVLYRAHYVSRAIEGALITSKIPYTIYSGTPFFSRGEIKDALSYLRMIAYRDDLSFRRIVNRPRRNIGKTRMAAIEEYAAEHGIPLYSALKELADTPLFKGTGAASFIKLIGDFSREADGRAVSEVLADILIKSGYEKALRTEGDQVRLDNLAELKQSVFEYEATCGEEVTLEHYLSHAAMFTNADTADAGDRVKLMTVHAAKGLEFKIVFLCGMNEGIFPSRKVRTRRAMEEERRLAFVAVTRAKERLFLSEAAGTNLDGSERYPSRFLLDMKSVVTFDPEPKEDVIREAERHAELSDERLTEEDAAPLTAGQRVRHSVFGCGTVLEISDEAYLVKFESMDTPRRISRRARLTPLSPQPALSEDGPEGGAV